MTKLILDILISSILGMIFFIPFLIVFVLVKLTSTGPAIHWSKRIGKDNKLFLMPKFRTMRIDTPQMATHLFIEVNSYLTPPGSFLRKTSLDEIPQLWSVMKGDMSLVGPRPALFTQNDLVEARTDENIHSIRPGITGWAQINGRDELSIDEKIKFDKEYLEKISIKFDLKILLLTAYKVLKRSGIKH
jgi:O-antigen biosynthesis protein WbqP